ncbi:MAG: potassium channel protein [Spirochaetales bacterium]|nr:potassium channel protein [Spirochaetales bacterium]
MQRIARHRLITLATLFLLCALAVSGFSYFEGLSFFDALWMTFTSLLTIGYGDVIPHTTGGRIFALFMVPLCIISFTYLAGNLLSTLIESNLTVLSRSRRMIKRIRRFNQHIIICGAEGMSAHIIEQLKQKEIPFVLIDREEKRLEAYVDDCLIVVGDPSEEEVLQRAGIDKAEALLAVQGDAENLLICLTARELREDLNIICAAEKRESEKKLKRAGANFVINAERIGGNRMILSALKPAAVDYIDKFYRDGQDEFHVEKFLLTDKSTLIGKNLKQAKLRELYEVSVMGIQRDGQIMTAGLAEMPMKSHDALILFGKAENLERMENLVQADSLA